MKMKREFIILILIIAALSLYIFLQKRGKTHYSLPVLQKIEAKDISKITIEKGSSEITLDRGNGRWLILPQKYPADDDRVEDIADAIGSPTLTALASESKNYTLYELDEGRKMVVTIYVKEKVLRKMEIGKTAPSFRHTFVKIDDDHRVYHARGNLKDTFDTDVPALRDKRVLTIGEDIFEISLTDSKRKMTLVKKTAPTGSDSIPETERGKNEGTEVIKERESKWTTKEGKPVVDEDVDEIVETLKNLLCDGFVDDKAKEDLKNPMFTVTLTGKASHTLSLFDKKEKQYVATSSGSEYAFLISEWKAKKIKKDLNSLIVEEKISEAPQIRKKI